MAISSFDMVFRVQGGEEAEAFMDALMELSDTRSEEPQARIRREDPVTVTEKMLGRYGQIQ